MFSVHHHGVGKPMAKAHSGLPRPAGPSAWPLVMINTGQGHSRHQLFFFVFFLRTVNAGRAANRNPHCIGAGRLAQPSGCSGVAPVDPARQAIGGVIYSLGSARNSRGREGRQLRGVMRRAASFVAANRAFHMDPSSATAAGRGPLP